MKNLSVIIPVYNDEKKLVTKTNILLKKLKKLKLKYEIIFINDGSSDKSNNHISNLIKKNKYITLINNKVNMGKSFSIIKALKKTKFNYVILIDSDLPYFSKFSQVVRLLKKNYELVFIDRRHPKSQVNFEKFSIYTLLRFIIGYLISLYFKYLINAKNYKIDTQAGLKGFKKIQEIHNKKFISKRFFFDVELIFLYLKNKKNIASIPVKYKISKSSSIKLINLRQNIKIFIELLKVSFNIVSARIQYEKERHQD